jgi:hypothetical protein
MECHKTSYSNGCAQSLVVLYTDERHCAPIGRRRYDAMRINPVIQGTSRVAIASHF